MPNWLHFLQEQPSALSSSVFYWLRFLLLLAGSYAIFSCVLSVMRRRGSKLFLNEKEKIITAAMRASTYGIMLILGMVIGMGMRDHQLVSRTITYRNILIRQKVADRDFWVLPQWMEPQRVQLCKDSTVDWRAGEWLADWKFEQEPGCKRVIYYHELPEGELNASIQMR